MLCGSNTLRSWHRRPLVIQNQRAEAEKRFEHGRRMHDNAAVEFHVKLVRPNHHVAVIEVEVVDVEQRLKCDMESRWMWDRLTFELDEQTTSYTPLAEHLFWPYCPSVPRLVTCWIVVEQLRDFVRYSPMQRRQRFHRR